MHKVDIKSTNDYYSSYEDGYIRYYKNKFGCPLEFNYSMYEWLNDNIDNGLWKFYNRYVKSDDLSVYGYKMKEYFGIEFVNEEDAMVFKMRWL